MLLRLVKNFLCCCCTVKQNITSGKELAVLGCTVKQDITSGYEPNV